MTKTSSWMPSEAIEINGAKMSASGLVKLLKAITNPDPNVWFRFERDAEGKITVHRHQSPMLAPTIVYYTDDPGRTITRPLTTDKIH